MFVGITKIYTQSLDKIQLGKHSTENYQHNALKPSTNTNNKLTSKKYIPKKIKHKFNWFKRIVAECEFIVYTLKTV